MPATKTRGRVASRSHGKVATKRRDVAEEITSVFIAAIEKAIEEGGTAPWRNPWVAGGRPVSMSTRKPYQGMNQWILGMMGQARGHASTWWGTYNQIKALGGQVRKGNCDKSCQHNVFADCGGNHGVQVVLYKTFTKTEVNDLGEEVERKIPLLRGFTVFNAEQADGLPERFLGKQQGEVVEMPEPQAVLDAYLDSPGAADFFQDVQGQAFFIPALNEVHVPPMSGHKTPDLYWTTVFHEITHAADWKVRRNAEEADHRTQETYSFGELVAELVAELGASFLAAETGVRADADNSVSYLRGWLRALKDDTSMLLKASAAARRAADLIIEEPQAEVEQAENELQVA